MLQAYCLAGGGKGAQTARNDAEPTPPSISMPLHLQEAWENLVLTVVLIDQSIADLIGCDLAIGLSWFCPAQLGHRRRDYVESQPPRLTGYWKGTKRALSEGQGQG